MGIYLSASSNNNTLSGNNVTANNNFGIWLESSSNNVLSGNNFANDVYGMGLSSSDNNTLSDNNVTANGHDGIYLSSSSGNTFFHNRFVNNAEQVSSDGSPNTWDDGYPSGGNYWSNYAGTDLYDGPLQNLPGSDGMGDTPYTIDGNNRDNYPWMAANYTAPYQITFDQTGVGDDFGGPVITVDGADYNRSGVSFWWKAGSEHTFGFDSPLVVTANVKQYVLTGTSDSSPLTVSGSVTVTGTYKTQYYISVESAHGSPTEASQWVDAGTGFSVSVSSPDGDLSHQFVVVGSSIQSVADVESAQTLTFTWTEQWYITVASAHDSPTASAWVDAGTDFTASVTSPADIVLGDHQWVCNGYIIDGGSLVSGISHTFTSVAAAHTIEFDWTEQYYLTVDTSPPSVNSPVGEGWYDAGVTAHVSTDQYVDIVSLSSRYRFDSWTGASGTYSDATVTMDSAKTATANYVTEYYVSFAQSGVGGDFTGDVMSVDGVNYTGVGHSDWYDSGASVSFSFYSPLAVDSGKRYVLASVNASSPLSVSAAQTVTGTYKTQYYLAVTSAYGVVSGQGWYDSGLTTNAGLSFGSIDHGNGTQHVFVNWGSDASGTDYALSNAITMDGPKTALAVWKTQYELAMATNFGSTTPNVGGGHWYDAGSTVTIEATAPSAGAGERYVWNRWTGSGTGSYTGTDNPATDAVTMNGPLTETASWAHQYELTVTSVYDTPGGAGWYDSGSAAYASLTDGTVSGGAGTRYVFTSWDTDASGTNYAQSNAITMDGPKTATAGWKTQYYLTVETSPPGVNGPTGEGWYDAGVTAHVSTDQYVDIVSGSSRYRFDSWIGASGTFSDATVTMDSAKTATANYVTQYYVTFAQSGVATDFTGTVMTVGGTDYTRDGHSDWYDNGASITFSFDSPLVVTANVKQYVLTGTSDASPLTVSGSATVTGTYKTQYYITVMSAHGSPTQASQWVDQGSSFSVTVTSPDGDLSHQFVVVGPSTLTVPDVESAQALTFSWTEQWYISVTSLHGNPTASSGWVDDGAAFSVSVTNPDVVVADEHRWNLTGLKVDGVPQTLADSETLTGVNAAHSIEFVWMEQYYLTVTSAHDTPGGAGWYDSGSAAYASLTDGVVPGTSGTQYVFASWGTDASGSNYAQSDAMTMDGPKTATAGWTTRYYLTVNNGGHGTAGGEGWYDANVDAQATMTPLTVPGTTGTQYVFAGWSGDATGSGSPSNNILMTSPKTATATWTTQYNLAMSTNFGTTSPSVGGRWYDAGSLVTISATAPSAGAGERYVWNGWTGSGAGSYTGMDNPATGAVTMNGPVTEAASWTHEYYVAVPLSGWQEDPEYSNASYVLTSGPSSLYLELGATDTSSRVTIYTLIVPKSDLGGFDHIDVSVTGTSNARILLRFFLDDGSGFDVVYWSDPATLDAVNFNLKPYAGKTLTIAYVALMSSDGLPADIDITQIALVVTPLPPEVPLASWVVDSSLTNAPYILSSSASSLSLQLNAADISSRVTIYTLGVPALNLGDYDHIDVAVTGTANARILLRFFMDNGAGFDVVYWADPATLNAITFDLSAYSGRTLTIAYVALMSSDGLTASVDFTQIAFVASAPPPVVPLASWVVDSSLTNAPYTLSSTESELSLDLDASDTGSRVTIYTLGVPALNLGNYNHIDVSVTGTSNARILLRFFLDDGSGFDVVYWSDPATLDAINFDLSAYAGRTLKIAYVALMSSDGLDASIDITGIALVTEAPPPLVPLSSWTLDPSLTNAPYTLDSSPSLLSLDLTASDTHSRVTIYTLGVPTSDLGGFDHIDVAVTGTGNARILLRFFLDDGTGFDVVYWSDPATLDAISFDLSPYTGRTLTVAYFALMSSDGSTASIDVTQIALVA
jgi:uncharacterized repeat protein (TIGR02543 family)